MDVIWWLVILVVVIAACAIAYQVTSGMGVVIPDWVRNILWILFAVFVFIVAIKILLGLLGIW